MQFFIILLGLLTQLARQVSICNTYLQDVDSCLHLTSRMCQWASLTSTCIPVSALNMGCDFSLNRQACQAQLTDSSGAKASCYFGERCRTATPELLSTIDCNPNLSKYACLSILTKGQQCAWKNGFCQKLEQNLRIIPIVDPNVPRASESVERCISTLPISEETSEEEIETSEILSSEAQGRQEQPQTPTLRDLNPNCFVKDQMNVNPIVCQLLNKDFPCMHGGEMREYQCIDLNVTELNLIVCEEPGINRHGCKSITTPGQKCIYTESGCLAIQSFSQLNCTSQVNKEGCLSFNDKENTCSWNDTLKVCELVFNRSMGCLEYVDVSPNTCSLAQAECFYNPQIGGCDDYKIESSDCDLPGLSFLACQQIKAPCKFSDKCSSINEFEKFTLTCRDNVNKQGCLSIQTAGQTCQWDSLLNECLKIQIQQIDPCNFTDVNGNVCKMVTMEGCKYDLLNSQCVKNDITEDTCETQYLNIQGCVEVSVAGNVCRWNSLIQQCTSFYVVPGVTKCTDLINVNAAACQQVSRPEPLIQDRNCMYKASARGCIKFSQPTAEQRNSLNYVPIRCDAPGLNIFGCITVDTKQIDRCRWNGQSCETIRSQSQVQSLDCIDLKHVNAASCQWILGQQERCKYEPVSGNCIPTVNIYTDKCDTPGLNAYGCGALRSVNCYFDMKQSQCLSTDQLSQTQLEDFYGSQQCSVNYPTKENCLRISTFGGSSNIAQLGIPTQKCGWDLQQNLCVDIYVTPKDQCSDYKSVNYNTCAGINPVKIIPDSYCVYDQGTNSCTSVNIYIQYPCTAPGLNIYSCNANTDKLSYCYFDMDNQRCLFFGTSLSKTPSQAQAFFSDNQLVCEQLNYLGCAQNIWSPDQKCYFNKRCVNVDFDNDPTGLYTCDYFNQPGIIANYWVCVGVKIPGEYCQYDQGNLNCMTVTQSLKCTDQYQNKHSCLAKTKNFDCIWNFETQTCGLIEAQLLGSLNCSSPINQKMCHDFEGQACVFDQYLAVCNFTQITRTTKCVDLAKPGFTYSQQSCQNVGTPGQFCAYDNINNICRTQTSVVSTCKNPGFNNYSCFSKTNAECFWNVAKSQCDDVSTLLQAKNLTSSSQLGCEDSVNKVVCLKIRSSPCFWDTVNGFCGKFTVTPQTTVKTLNGANNYQYNAIACQSVTFAQVAVSWDSGTNVCVEQFSTLTSCNQKALNKFACIKKTTGYCSWSQSLTTCVTVPAVTSQLNLYKCDDPINQGICLDNTINPCQWKNNTCSKVIQTTQTCSQFSDSSVALYSIMVCVNVNSTQKFDYDQVVKTQCKDVISARSSDKRSDFCSYMADLQVCESLYDLSQTSVQEFNANQQLVNVSTCTELSYSKCYSNLNIHACLMLTDVECIFKNSSGCQSPDPNYMQILCSEANQFVCTNIRTVGQLCYLDDNNVCSNYTIPSGANDCTDVNELVNPNVCSALDIQSYCIYSETTSGCISTTKQNVLNYQCGMPGLNKRGCGVLTTNCIFNQTQKLCTTKDQDSQISSCELANTKPVGPNDLSIVGPYCAGVTQFAQTCYFNSDTSRCTQFTGFADFSCSQLGFGKGSGNSSACAQLSYSDSDYPPTNIQWCYFDSVLQSCTKLNPDAQQKVCTNLNKAACLYATTQSNSVYCGWYTETIDGDKQAYCKGFTKTELASKEVQQNVQGCADYNANACQQVAAVNACYLNSDDICQDFTDTTLKCTDSSLKNVNEVACAIQTINVKDKQYCQYSFKNGVGSCKNVGNKVACSTPGLNIYACLSYTGFISVNNIDQPQSCYWNSTIKKCFQVVETDIYSTLDCSDLNQGACHKNTNPTQACQWNNVSCVDQSKKILNCTSYDNSKVSQYTCAMTLDQACAYSLSELTCVSKADTSGLLCTELGLNKLGCLTKTQGYYCQWYQSNYSCLALNDLSHSNCTDALNVDACVSLPGICYFNTTDNTCYPVVINSTTPTQVVTDPTLKINQQACAKILVPGGYVAYDKSRQLCILLSDASYSCNQVGINKWGCLGKTKELCVYSQELGCQPLLDISGVQCSDTLSVQSCIAVSGMGCKYDKLIDQCTQVEETDQCLLIENNPFALTNPDVCTFQDLPCQYNETTQACQVVQGKSFSSCEQSSISQAACLRFTTVQCVFRDLQCQAEDYVDTYRCTDAINIINCVSITNPGVLCYFQDQCQDFLIRATTQCPTTFLVNPATCTQIIKEDCLYNEQNQKCKRVDSQTLCTSPSMNIQACQLVYKAEQYCVFEDGRCNKADITKVNCSSPVNQNTCLGLTTPGQNCYWDSNFLICYPVPKNARCSDLKLVNNKGSCAIAIDFCVYDTVNNNTCITPTKTNYPCNYPGLSKKACFANTQDKKICLFDDQTNQCYLPSTLTKCEQATTRLDCVGVINTCQWVDGLCQQFDSSQLDCGSPELVNITKDVCGQAMKANKLLTCAYLPDTASCYQQPPEGCAMSLDYDSCVRLSNDPCIWENNACSLKFIKSQPEQYTCSMLNSVVSQRVCLDLIRVGEFCIYRNQQCQPVDPSTVTSCKQPLNYDACVSVTGQQCYWNELNTTVMDYIFPTDGSAIVEKSLVYVYGECDQASKENMNTFKCSVDLSFLTCVSITTPNEFCIWQGSVCSRVPFPQMLHPPAIDITTYQLVNPNLCALINETNVYAKYDQLVYSCTLADITQDICITPGLNRLACLNLKTGRCQWDSSISRCTYMEEFQQDLTRCHQLKDVSEQVCASIVGLSCYYNYFLFQCEEITLDTRCDARGLNKEGCLSIRNHPCSWNNDSLQCEQNIIIPDVTKCESFKYQVNPFTCAQVSYFKEICLFDPNLNNCNAITQITTQDCTTTGLNLNGCSHVKVDQCVFSQGYCMQFNQKFPQCDTIGSANPYTCTLVKQPADPCKFDALEKKCGSSSVNDYCSTSGLNPEACAKAQGCYFNDILETCRCEVYDQRYPPCEQINLAVDCKARPDCYFNGSKIDASTYSSQIDFNITEYLIKTQTGQCITIECSSMYLNGFVEDLAKPYEVINNKYCLNSTDYQGRQCFESTIQSACFTVSKCEDIAINDLMFYALKQCQTFTFNGVPCVNGQETCVPLDCRSLKSEQECRYFSDNCVFVSPDCEGSPAKCVSKTCEDLPKSECKNTRGGRSCTWIGNLCRGFSNCNDVNSIELIPYYKEQVCNSLIQRGLQCGYVNTQPSGTQQYCSDTPCRFQGSSRVSCEGKHIFNQVCVIGNDKSCLSCEEIMDSCLCLSKEPLCAYDNTIQKCYSQPCSIYQNKSDCLGVNQNGVTTCQWKKKKQKCVPSCSRHFSKTTCEAENCEWKPLDGNCVEAPLNNRRAPIRVEITVWGSLITFLMCLPLLS